MSKENLKVLLSTREIADKVQELARQVSQDYRGKNPLLVCVLKGAVVFLADLIRCLEIPVEIDFMAVSSYGDSTQTSGVVRILKDLDTSVEGRDILLVEDIIDTGLTLSYLRENLLSRNPRSVKLIALLDKPERRQVDVEPDFCGFCIPDQFVVGYGLDYKQQYRHLPEVCVLLEFA